MSPITTPRDGRLRAAAAAALALGGLWITTPAHAGSARIAAELASSTLAANARTTTYLRVGLTGFELPDSSARPPLNVALVIDRSGSMTGSKMERAKDAALAALSVLGPDDIVSVIGYDSIVSVLVPATKVRDRGAIVAGIRRLRPSGMTALFGGTSKGADEVRKFLDDLRVNRVVLLSDGRANVGPSSPGELGRLGAALRSEGISVTTVGLGLDYNEDLMVSLARRSGGQHHFVEHASELAEIFRRGFGGLASICARDVVVEIALTPGFRPIRVLGLDAEIIGSRVRVDLAQLYAGHTDEVILELETARVPVTESQALAQVAVRYRNLITQQQDLLSASVSAAFSSSPAEVSASQNRGVMEPVVSLIATERNETAMRMRDEGKRKEAEQLMLDNTVYLEKNAELYRSEKLQQQREQQVEDRENLDDQKWNKQRKKMRRRTFDLHSF